MNRISILTGNYGSGKTEIALEMARRLAAKGRTALVDLDIVNPYFRSSEYGELLESRGIRLIAPVFAGTTLDTPTLPPEIYSIFEGGGQVFLDVGGDDAGITALGGLHEQMEEAGYEMLYVINRYRVLSQKPEEAAALLREIESASRLKATGLVNNSHLGVETKLSTVLDSLPYAEETHRLTGLPLLYSTVPDFALEKEAQLPAGCRKISRLVRFLWE